VKKKAPKREQPGAELPGQRQVPTSFLQPALDTKILARASIRASPVLIEGCSHKLEALTIQRPKRTTLEKHEIDQINAYFFADQRLGFSRNAE
jgi:hypothetical protein